MIRVLIAAYHGWQCWPWAHDWDKRKVTTAPDISSRGELWRCNSCPCIKAK